MRLLKFPRCKSNAESVEVAIDYSDEYFTLGNDFYCDVTVYEFSGAYSDQEFEDNELWENYSKVQRVAQVNSRTGDVTRGKLTIPIKAGVTLNPGDRLIIKLRLPPYRVGGRRGRLSFHFHSHCG